MIVDIQRLLITILKKERESEGLLECSLHRKMVEVVEVKRMMDGIGWNKPNSMETLNDPIHYIKFSCTGRMEDTKL